MMTDLSIGLRLLETLTSALYDDPIVLFREYVQNSVDAFNSSSQQSDIRRETFSVDINYDTKGRSISICDNGPGIAPSEFISEMTSIAKSKKIKTRGQIGFRGIGRLSGMPFCKSLVFSNKASGSNTIQTFTWDGERFQELLLLEEESDLEPAIEAITDYDTKPYEYAIEDHYFRVDLHGFKQEIALMLEDPDFKYRLQMMLPVDYAPEFSYGADIRKHYETYMGRPLSYYTFTIKLNGEELYKPYSEKNTLESGIHFWDVRYKSKKQGIPGDKMGVLWFTFNRKVIAENPDQPYGILVRSKNMLMGSHNTLVDAVFPSRGGDDYIATHRELTQTIQGVYGELLLDSENLHDNARRDWFRVDNASEELRNVCVAFLRLLYRYRKTASKAFNAIETDKNRDNLRAAYSELTSNYEPEQFIKEFYIQKRTCDKETEDTKDTFVFADEDIPRATINHKKYYDQLLKLIREYHLEKNQLDEFVKIRAYVKKRIAEELQK